MGSQSEVSYSAVRSLVPSCQKALCHRGKFYQLNAEGSKIEGTLYTPRAVTENLRIHVVCFCCLLQHYLDILEPEWESRLPPNPLRMCTHQSLFLFSLRELKNLGGLFKRYGILVVEAFCRCVGHRCRRHHNNRLHYQNSN